MWKKSEAKTKSLKTVFRGTYPKWGVGVGWGGALTANLYIFIDKPWIYRFLDMSCVSAVRSPFETKFAKPHREDAPSFSLV